MKFCLWRIWTTSVTSFKMDNVISSCCFSNCCAIRDLLWNFCLQIEFFLGSRWYYFFIYHISPNKISCLNRMIFFFTYHDSLFFKTDFKLFNSSFSFGIINQTSNFYSLSGCNEIFITVKITCYDSIIKETHSTLFTTKWIHITCGCSRCLWYSW